MLVSRAAGIDEQPDGFFKYRVRFDGLEAVPHVGAICVSRPTNPSGNVLTLDELARLDALCREVIRPHYEQRSRQAVEWLQDACDGLPLRIHRPEGAFVLWLWFPGLPITSRELYLRLRARGVLVLSGHHFFPGLDEPWQHRDECRRIRCSQAPDSVRAGIRLVADEVRRAYGG